MKSSMMEDDNDNDSYDDDDDDEESSEDNAFPGDIDLLVVTVEHGGRMHVVTKGKWSSIF